MNTAVWVKMSSFNKFLSVLLLLVVGIQTTVMVGVGRKLDTLTKAVRQTENNRKNEAWPHESIEPQQPSSQTPATQEKYHLITDKQLRNLIQQSQSVQAGFAAPGDSANQVRTEGFAPEAETVDRQEEVNALSYQVNSEMENAVAFGRLELAELNTLAQLIGKLGPQERTEQLRQLTQAINRQQIQIDLPQ